MPHDRRLRIAVFLDGLVGRVGAAIEPSHHSLRHYGTGLPEGAAEIKRSAASERCFGELAPGGKLNCLRRVVIAEDRADRR